MRRNLPKIICIPLMLLIIVSAAACAPGAKKPAGKPSEAAKDKATAKSMAAAARVASATEEQRALMKRLDRAKEALGKNQKDTDALTEVGDTHFDLGAAGLDSKKNYEESIVYFKRALDIDPGLSATRTNMAVSYYQLGQSFKAKEELYKVIMIDNHYARAYYDMGIILARTDKDVTTAIWCFKNVVRLTPGNNPYHKRAEKFLKSAEVWVQGHVQEQQDRKQPQQPDIPSTVL